MPLYSYFLTSSAICRASSRVGESTRTLGPPRFPLGMGWLSMWMKQGMRKARVLPVPVWAMPITS